VCRLSSSIGNLTLGRACTNRSNLGLSKPRFRDQSELPHTTLFSLSKLNNDYMFRILIPLYALPSGMYPLCTDPFRSACTMLSKQDLDTRIVYNLSCKEKPNEFILSPNCIPYYFIITLQCNSLCRITVWRIRIAHLQGFHFTLSP
jgi:hypothetical protein